jgi:hypothetical protein
LKTDASVHEHHFEHQLPWYCVDDCGLMIGHMGTIYWIDAEEFRKTWMLNLGRGNLMPFIYGDLRLFNDSDRKFIVKMWRLVRDNSEIFANTQIIGKPDGDGIYGYSHFKGQHGFVFLNNPTFRKNSIVLNLDVITGLSASARSTLRFFEIFPMERTYASKPGESPAMELGPFEVRALEIKPAVGNISGAVDSWQNESVSIPLPLDLTAKTSNELTDAMIDMANKELAHLIDVVTTRIEKPKNIERAGLKSIYSFSIDLPKFDKPRTLALPVRFMAGNRPVRQRDPNTCALAVAWSDSGQITLDMTPKAHVWSGCSWLTFRAALDPSFSGKKIDALLLNIGLEGADLKMDKAYLLDENP